MDDCAEKTEIDSIIENIISQNPAFCDLRKQMATKIINIQKQIDSKIIELVYEKQKLDTQISAIKDLGGIESVKNNITALRKKKETLAATLKISADDITRFDKAVEDKILLGNEIKILTADKELIGRKKKVRLLMPSQLVCAKNKRPMTRGAQLLMNLSR